MILLGLLLFLPILYVIGAILFGMVTAARASAELLKPKGRRWQGEFWKGPQ